MQGLFAKNLILTPIANLIALFEMSGSRMQRVADRVTALIGY